LGTVRRNRQNQTNPEPFVSPTADNAIASPSLDWSPVLPVRSIARLRIIRPQDLEIDFAAAQTGGARRMLNVFLALLGLVLAAPLMLVVAILVKLSSPGPVIYRQSRVGVDRRRPGSSPFDGQRRFNHGGQIFTMYKFRTMRADAGEAQVWARQDDCRITAVGRVLRKYRLDELPQLVNVLRGEMNVVGPRPEQPDIFLTLRDEVERYALRQRVLPGITGWAQVNHGYDQSVDDVRTKVRYDLEYLENASVARDIQILARTVPVVMFKRGGW
jgi:lipopolysaccharide/colanic/teichoic acid biosynthesis glycosyltransferase